MVRDLQKLAQLQAMVKSDEAVIEQAKTNLSYTQLTAPIDGVTGHPISLFDPKRLVTTA